MINVNDRFIYIDGKLFQRNKNGYNKRPFGTRRQDGYIQGKIDKKFYFAHRLIWQYFNGDIPEGMIIDHINGVRDDNRIEILDWLIVHRTIIIWLFVKTQKLVSSV